jgi:EF-P beta-lysylation protein EpmB
MPVVPASPSAPEATSPETAEVPIDRTASQSRQATWQRELSQAIRSVSELFTYLGLDPSSPGQVLSTSGARNSESSFPLLVPRSFADRMTPGDIADPLLRQVLPTDNESVPVEGFTADAVGDANARRAPGLLQKYAGRVLLITTGACAIHCRYCFRREYPYAAEPRRRDDWTPALNEIAGDPSIQEIILSGGDPLILSDERLAWLAQQIDRIPHVERLRIHTRLPIVLPSRVTTELLELLTSLRLQSVVVVHANHPREVVAECAVALRRMVRAGLPVLNQTVLLRGINDSVEALEALCRSLVNLGVLPYYLHQLDRVTGTAHFDVPRERGRHLIEQLSSRLPGYAVPKYVEEIPGRPGKSLIAAAPLKTEH